MESLTVHIRGVRPIILHNVTPSLDPFNELLREQKAITNKTAKKRTDEDHRRLCELDWHMSMYSDEDGGVIVPADNLERMVRDGAAESRKGKQVEAGIQVLEHAPLQDARGSQFRDPDKLWKSEKHTLRKAVRVNSARVLRTRPIFNDWQLTFTIAFLPRVISGPTIRDALEIASVIKGLGDWRPRFGRFEIVEVTGGE